MPQEHKSRLNSLSDPRIETETRSQKTGKGENLTPEPQNPSAEYQIGGRLRRPERIGCVLFLYREASAVGCKRTCQVSSGNDRFTSGSYGCIVLPRRLRETSFYSCVQLCMFGASDGFGSRSVHALGRGGIGVEI